MEPVGRLDFGHLLGDRRRAARKELAEAMQVLASRIDPAGAEASAGVGADAYFEPRLYTQLAFGGFTSVTLHQLLLAFDERSSKTCRALTDDTGTAYFPGLGRCSTRHHSSEIQVTLDTTGRQASVSHAGEPGEEVVPLAPSTFVPGTRIELTNHLDPTLLRFVEHHVDNAEKLTPVANPEVFVPSLERALELISAVAPEYHDMLLESVRSVLLFRHPEAESFAALGMHGMLFLNVPEQPGADYFVEELVHQGGHVVFSEATLHRGDFFRADPDTALAEFLGRPDSRTTYDAFHGLFTEHMESQIVLGVLAHGLATDAERLDFRRHLAAVTDRHRHDLSLIDPYAADIFSQAGAEVYVAFQTGFDRAMRDHAELLTGPTEAGSRV